MRRRQAALRAERKPVEVLVLGEILTRRIRIAVDADARITNGDRADLARRAQVRLQERRRAAERVSHIIEPVRRIIRRQQRRDVDV